MKLLTAHIYPDVKGTEVNVWVTRKTKSVNIKKRCHTLVGDGYIHVLHGNYVANVAICSIEGFYAL